MPEYGERLKAVLTPAQLHAYRFNFVPSFVAGQPFSFSRVEKDKLDHVDNPILELTYWQAVEVASIIGTTSTHPPFAVFDADFLISTWGQCVWVCVSVCVC